MSKEFIFKCEKKFKVKHERDFQPQEISSNGKEKLLYYLLKFIIQLNFCYREQKACKHFPENKTLPTKIASTLTLIKFHGFIQSRNSSVASLLGIKASHKAKANLQ